MNPICQKPWQIETQTSAANICLVQVVRGEFCDKRGGLVDPPQRGGTEKQKQGGKSTLPIHKTQRRRTKAIPSGQPQQRSFQNIRHANPSITMFSSFSPRIHTVLDKESFGDKMFPNMSRKWQGGLDPWQCQHATLSMRSVTKQAWFGENSGRSYSLLHSCQHMSLCPTAGAPRHCAALEY